MSLPCCHCFPSLPFITNIRYISKLNYSILSAQTLNFQTILSSPLKGLSEYCFKINLSLGKGLQNELKSIAFLRFWLASIKQIATLSQPDQFRYSQNFQKKLRVGVQRWSKTAKLTKSSTTPIRNHQWPKSMYVFLIHF